MSMIDGLRNVLGINQDPEADSYVDDNEEDDIFPRSEEHTSELQSHA